MPRTTCACAVICMRAQHNVRCLGHTAFTKQGRRVGGATLAARKKKKPGANSKRRRSVPTSGQPRVSLAAAAARTKTCFNCRRDDHTKGVRLTCCWCSCYYCCCCCCCCCCHDARPARGPPTAVVAVTRSHHQRHCLQSCRCYPWHQQQHHHQQPVPDKSWKWPRGCPAGRPTVRPGAAVPPCAVAACRACPPPTASPNPSRMFPDRQPGCEDCSPLVLASSKSPRRCRDSPAASRRRRA